MAAMEELDALPDITRLTPNVVRILGQNPGKFTLQGTNTYLIGQQNPYILIDAGEGKSEYIPILHRALTECRPSNPDSPDVSDIILTHRHHDHIDGLPSVLDILNKLWNERSPGKPFPRPKIHKIPLPSPDPHLHSVASSIPTHLHSPTPDGNPIHDLQDGQQIPISTSPPSHDSHLLVLHAPGHTPDSLCLYLPIERSLFTADSVLGHGTAVFEDLRDYMSSLRKMIDFNNLHSKGKYDTVYPGHGNIILNGPKHISMYLQHRIDREQQIIQVLNQPPPPLSGETPSQGDEAVWTTWSLVGMIYHAYPQSLWEPAAHSADLHLKKLEAEGRVRRGKGTGKDTQWFLVKE